MNNKGILIIPLLILIASVSIIMISLEGSRQDEIAYPAHGGR